MRKENVFVIGDGMIQIFDTFEDFKSVFKDNLNLSIEEKIELWEKGYISKYPELEAKCKGDYVDSGYDWREIATTLVFNRTRDDFDKMMEAYNNILKVIDDINNKVKQVFQMELDINIVLYCGLCNSAGWVTTYNGKRAILFGIDKMAELNWHTMEKVQPLIAHELCHVIHFELRGEDDLNIDIERSNYNKGIWRIYEEGFAQFYQQKLLDKDIDSRGREWEDKCAANIDKLKKLYLEALSDEEKGSKEFFGDWFQVMGISDVGYFLGAQLIKKINEELKVDHIAKLEFKEIEQNVIKFLKS